MAHLSEESVFYYILARKVKEMKMIRYCLASTLFAVLLLNACLVFRSSEATETYSEDEPTQLPRIIPERPSSGPVTFYVRPDGGPADQCTGLVDAAFSIDASPACAWQHPFLALPPEGPSYIMGGDTLIIHEGSYMMGYGAPGSNACDKDYPWDCFMISIPGGPDAEHPTRILGAGWDTGCANPPELWGTERASTVLNLLGSNHVEIGCFDITDHAGCADSHTGGMACKRNRYPYGPWADDGINAADSADVYLHDLHIHGFASAGIRAGRLQDWLVERVSIVANGWVGWEGDIDGADHNSGTMTFREWTVAWNGCVETYPEQQPAGCWAQTAGGYGDGVGTGETGGYWLIEDSAFLYNTSDGLDLLYVRSDPSSITLRRVIAGGNAGNQLKTNGPTVIENSVVVGNCGYFEGQPYTHNVDACRAAGNAVSLDLHTGDQVFLNNNTIVSEGDCLVLAECDDEFSACDGSERVRMRNNLLVGHPDFIASDELTCLAYADRITEQVFDMDYSLITNTKSTPPCPGAHDLCEVDPGVFNPAIDAFDGRLKEVSPAIGSANPVDAPTNDITGRLRDATPDIGAYEYVSPTSKIYFAALYAKGGD
jgi:hypothetical protein